MQPEERRPRPTTGRRSMGLLAAVVVAAATTTAQAQLPGVPGPLVGGPGADAAQAVGPGGAGQQINVQQKPCCSVFDLLGAKQIGKAAGRLGGTRLGQFVGKRLVRPVGGVLGLRPSIVSPKFAEAPGALGLAYDIKKKEAEVGAKVQAIEYLGTLDCTCYGEVIPTLIDELEGSCFEEVRYAALMALRNTQPDQARGLKERLALHFGCSVECEVVQNGCTGCQCYPEVVQALDRLLTARTPTGCFEENSPRVRGLATAMIQECLANRAAPPIPVEGPEPPKKPPVKRDPVEKAPVKKDPVPVEEPDLMGTEDEPETEPNLLSTEEADEERAEDADEEAAKARAAEKKARQENVRRQKAREVEDATENPMPLPQTVPDDNQNLLDVPDDGLSRWLRTMPQRLAPPVTVPSLAPSIARPVAPNVVRPTVPARQATPTALRVAPSQVSPSYIPVAPTSQPATMPALRPARTSGTVRINQPSRPTAPVATGAAAPATIRRVAAPANPAGRVAPAIGQPTVVNRPARPTVPATATPAGAGVNPWTRTVPPSRQWNDRTPPTSRVPVQARPAPAQVRPAPAQARRASARSTAGQSNVVGGLLQNLLD